MVMKVAAALDRRHGPIADGKRTAADFVDRTRPSWRDRIDRMSDMAPGRRCLAR
jgi:hypothetical protein